MKRTTPHEPHTNPTKPARVKGFRRSRTAETDYPTQTPHRTPYGGLRARPRARLRAPAPARARETYPKPVGGTLRPPTLTGLRTPGSRTHNHTKT